MACPQIITGEAFLTSTLAHIDCQAQAIGSFGFAALSDPSSPLSQIVTTLLVLFVAIFGLRLLLGHPVGAGDVVTAFLKIGIVLALATSWPAYRTVVYDTVFHGPAEVANAIGSASGLPGPNADFSSRLETVDTAILELTAMGSGRIQPIQGTVSGESRVEAFRPYAVSDGLAFGSARVTWLTGTIGSLAIVRIGAGILLALAPIMAGLLLFGATRALFVGWLQGLGLMALGSLAISILLAVEVAIFEPLLTSALNFRAAGLATPAAPSELLVIALAFTVAQFAMIAILARIIFSHARSGLSQTLRGPSAFRAPPVLPAPTLPRAVPSETVTLSRPRQLLESVAIRQPRTGSTDGAFDRRTTVSVDARASRAVVDDQPRSRSGSDNSRRNYRRVSRASVRRDRSA